MRINFINRRVDRRGRWGSTAIVRVGTPQHPGRYYFDTHGMSDTQIEKRIRQLVAKHERDVAKRQELIADVEGREFTVQGRIYRIVDANFWPIGRDDQLLRIVVRAVLGDTLGQVPGFPLEQWYPSVDDFPPSADIRAAVVARLQWLSDQATAEVQREQRLIDSVKDLLGL